jgi:DNA-binding PadR family transcriptional regulator
MTNTAPEDALPEEAPASEAKWDACICPTGKVERFLQACLLLFLAGGPSHGYDLYQELISFGLSDEMPDPATVYKNLRRMEERGLIVSEWQPGEAGPGRRSYETTEKGMIYLERWEEALLRGKATIDKFLAQKQAYHSRVKPSEAPTQVNAGGAL